MCRNCQLYIRVVCQFASSTLMLFCVFKKGIHVCSTATCFFWPTDTAGALMPTNVSELGYQSLTGACETRWAGTGSRRPNVESLSSGDFLIGEQLHLQSNDLSRPQVVKWTSSWISLFRYYLAKENSWRVTYPRNVAEMNKHNFRFQGKFWIDYFYYLYIISMWKT